MSIANRWMPFDEARTYAQGLNLNTRSEWYAWAKNDSRPSNVPADPHDAYMDAGWQGWGDWLGTGNLRGKTGPNSAKCRRCNERKNVYRDFYEAREYVQSLNIKNQIEWKEWANSSTRPSDIPKSPAYHYKERGWQGFGDWLGTGNLRPADRRFLSYDEAKMFARRLGLRDRVMWVEWAKSGARPVDIPALPELYYKDKGWINWRDWLGTETTRKRGRNFLPFAEAKRLVQSHHLANVREWEDWLKTDSRPLNIPTNPEKVYKTQGWAGWGDWLGSGRRSFEQARDFVRGLNLKNTDEWHQWVEAKILPTDIPGDPWRVYAEQGWLGINDWLGTQKSKYNVRQRHYRSFPEARSYVQSLKLSGAKEWRAWCRSNARPVDIPSDPARIYNNDGWIKYLCRNRI